LLPRKRRERTGGKEFSGGQTLREVEGRRALHHGVIEVEEGGRERIWGNCQRGLYFRDSQADQGQPGGASPGKGGQDGRVAPDVLMTISMAVLVTPWWHWVLP